MVKLVIIRHGESTWNKENRFTGWEDVELSEKGRGEAKNAAQVLKENGFVFDIAYTSVLKRAIGTLWSILEGLDLMWIPVIRSWKLNERHYGALQGLNKSETAEKHGEEQVKIWRRSYDVPPPALELSDKRHPSHNPRYREVNPEELPQTESLKETVDRVVPYWQDVIVPSIKEGKRVIIAAHGNTLRALVMYLDGLSKEEILQRNIPTGVPLVYELDDSLKPIKNYYLGDEEKIKAAMHSVANQGKAQAGS